MKIAFLAALLLSAQTVWAEDEEPNHKYAYCEISDKDREDAMEVDEDEYDDEDEGITGCLLFDQEYGKEMRVRGVLSTDEWVEPNDEKGRFEHHYLAIREFDGDDTCEKMGRLWPEFFEDNEDLEGECPLGTAKFDKAGDAIYKNKASPASLFCDDDDDETDPIMESRSIIGRGISVYSGMKPEGEDEVVACCTVKELDLTKEEDKKKLKAITRDLRSSKKEIKQRRRDERKKNEK